MTCSVDGCLRSVHGKGLCSMHWKRLWRNGTLDIVRNLRDDCSIDGCEGHHQAKGFCKKHYERYRRYGDPQRVLKVFEHGEKCTNDKCDRKYYARGVCSYHWQQLYLDRENKKKWSANYFKENPQVSRMAASRRRERFETSKKFTILKKEMKKIYSSPCAMCSSTYKIERDHIIPLSLGGDDSVGNSQPLCKSCNSSKGSKLWMEYRVWLKKS